MCKLKKSLYGLKQAPRAWNEKFTSFLYVLGSKISYANQSLFVKHSFLGSVVLLFYVDDTILTSSSSQLICDVILALTKEFNMKDLGQLNYFLGLQITYQFTSLFISQTKCIGDLLQKVDRQDCKPCATPCLPYHRLLKDEGKLYYSPEQYISIVGALQYLTFSRPDSAFSVNNQHCQFMHNSINSHVVAVKRILRYLTIDSICKSIVMQTGLVTVMTRDPLLFMLLFGPKITLWAEPRIVLGPIRNIENIPCQGPSPV